MSESNKPLIDPEAQKLINRAHKVKTDNLALFDIKEFQIDPNKIEQVEIPALKRIVKYKRLVIGDLFALTETKTRHEYSAKLIYIMLSKADPTVTFEQISNMPPDVASVIFDVLAEKIVFLKPEPIKTLESGLTKI